MALLSLFLRGVGGLRCGLLWLVGMIGRLVLKSNQYCCKLTSASLAVLPKVLIFQYLGAVTIMCHRDNLRLLAIVEIPSICRQKCVRIFANNLVLFAAQ